MSLTKTPAATATFEGEEGAALGTASVSSAVAAVGSTTGAVTIAPVKYSEKEMFTVSNLQNAMPVEWNTHQQLTIDKSAIKDKTTKQSVGEWVDLELLSWQHTWVCSPKDDDADVEVVKYSDDGVTTKDGLDCKAYIEEIRKDYPYATLEKRAIIMGGVVRCEKAKHLTDTLVQITLAPTAVTEFNRYMQNSAFAISKGKASPDAVKFIRVTASEGQGKGSKTYPLAKFSMAEAA